MPVCGYYGKACKKMTAADIVVHKGEKEEKYQLYVEDYVMSYLKNYRTENAERSEEHTSELQSQR